MRHFLEHQILAGHGTRYNVFWTYGALMNDVCVAFVFTRQMEKNFFCEAVSSHDGTHPVPFALLRV